MYYKVCARESTGLVSMVVRGRAKVSYGIGQVSTPPPWLEAQGYGLLVFSTLEQARHWAKTWGECRVFECEVGEVMPLPPCCSTFVASFRGRLAPIRDPWLEGSVMVSSVTLTKEV